MIVLGLEPLFHEWISTSRGKGKNNNNEALLSRTFLSVMVILEILVFESTSL